MSVEMTKDKEDSKKDGFLSADPLDRATRTKRQSGTLRAKVLVAVATVAVVVIAAGIVVYLNRSPYAIPRDVAERLDPTLQLLALRLHSEPCNQTLAKKLVSGLFDEDEYATIISFSEQMKAKCGQDEDLLVTLLYAQFLSSDLVGADGTANELVAQYPADYNAYSWRSQVREKRGDVPGAYADKRTALTLFPDPSNVALQDNYDLALLAVKAGFPCEGVATLRDYIAFDPEKRHTQQLTTLMGVWQTQGSCAPLSGTGSAFLRYDPQATAIIVPVEVNGVQTRMIVDTGATRTYLSKDLATRAGIQPSAQQGASVNTANGQTWVPGGRADYISIGTARLNQVPVFIQSADDGSFGKDADGLLGLSFLGNFQVRLNAGVLELRPLE